MESKLWLNPISFFCLSFRIICVCICLGQVNLEIEIAGKTLEFSVTPFHAAIIYKFQDKGKLLTNSFVLNKPSFQIHGQLVI